MRTKKDRTILLDLSILVLIVSTFLIISHVQVPHEKDIYGVWKGKHQGRQLLFRFNSDKTCVLSFEDNMSDTPVVLSGNFEVDLFKKPIPLTIRNIPQLDHSLNTIIQFIGDDSIRIAYFAPRRWRLRPISFDRNTSMILRRTDEN